MGIDRYQFIEKQIIREKGEVFQTTRLPKIEKSFSDRFIFTREGDRLDNLAFEFYGDPRYWFVLALANNLGKGTLAVERGLQLRVPPQSVITDMEDALEYVENNK
jgi:nucleoid-associated protein YgaU